jgi:signal transduction histidine kinase
MLAALALILLVGGGAYALLRYHLDTTTDFALQRRMAQEFRGLDAPLPPTLAAADAAWSQSRVEQVPADLSRRERGREHDDDEDGHESDERRQAAYDADLAAIAVLPLSADGTLLLDPNASPAPFPPDRAAAAAALANGSDWRTIDLPGGGRARLLSYRLTRSDGPAVLQLGRLLDDQSRLLGQLLVGLLALGGLGAVLVGAGSWSLAGRAIRPAEQAWQLQQTFVANASHELRTPLTLIRASAEMALRDTAAADGDQRALLADVLQECDHTARLVDDLLLLSRLDSGRLMLQRQVVDVPALLADVQRQVGRLAEERGVRLVVSSATGAVDADPTRLRQVLLILLDNALRYTPPGGEVRLDAFVQGSRLHLVVADTGSGIPAEDLSKVFDRFYRANGARDDKGCGLGLAIARGLVEAHKGTIRLQSEVQRGTRVEVSLPVAR